MSIEQEETIRDMVAGLDSTRRPDAIFVNVPLYDYEETEKTHGYTLPVLGLGYIATYAEKFGQNVGVIDGEADGLSLAQIVAAINELQPRWVGLNPLAPTAELSARIAASLDPAIKLMLGGHQAKAMPFEMMQDPRLARAEALVLGEGEYRALALLEDDSNRTWLPGVVWRHPDTGKLIANSSAITGEQRGWLSPYLDYMPFLDRRFLKSDIHFEEGRTEANMVGARGCPYDCSFCGAAVSANPDITIRARRPRDILEEMDTLALTRSVTAFRFVDDLFLGHRRFIEQCMSAFSSEDIGRHYAWDATGRINILHRAPDELLALLAENGCREIALGIESGSERLLAYMDKRITPEMIKSVVSRLTKFGISVKGYFIVGFPTETREELQSTIRLVHELWDITDNNPGRFRASAFEFRPYPGTPEWNRLLLTGKYTTKQLLAYTAVDLSSGGADESMRTRAEFNFSVGIQFGEATIEEVRAALAHITKEQYARGRQKPLLDPRQRPRDKPTSDRWDKLFSEPYRYGGDLRMLRTLVHRHHVQADPSHEKYSGGLREWMSKTLPHRGHHSLHTTEL